MNLLLSQGCLRVTHRFWRNAPRNQTPLMLFCLLACLLPYHEKTSVNPNPAVAAYAQKLSFPRLEVMLTRWMSCFSTHVPPPTTSTLATMAVRMTSLRQAGSGRETFSYPRAVSVSITDDTSFASDTRPPKPGNPAPPLYELFSVACCRITKKLR